MVQEHGRALHPRGTRVEVEDVDGILDELWASQLASRPKKLRAAVESAFRGAEAEAIIEIGNARRHDQDVLLLVDAHAVHWITKQGVRGSLPHSSIAKAEATSKWFGDRLRITDHGGHHYEFGNVAPPKRAAEIAELLTDPESRRALRADRAVRSIEDRRRALQRAILVETQKNMRVAYETDVEAILINSAGWRTHHGAHAVGTLLTMGMWSVVWGTQALRSAASRGGVLLTVDRLGRVNRTEQLEGALERLAALPPEPAPPTPIQTSAGGKRCPDCAETVLIEARKCRFCGYRFEALAA
jgi:hypothetical protein